MQEYSIDLYMIFSSSLHAFFHFMNIIHVHVIHVLCISFALITVDPFCHAKFVDVLMKTYTSEAVFLLTTFVNMARSRTVEDGSEMKFVDTIAEEIFQVRGMSNCSCRQSPSENTQYAHTRLLTRA